MTLILLNDLIESSSIEALKESDFLTYQIEFGGRFRSDEHRHVNVYAHDFVRSRPGGMCEATTIMSC